jgi:hypothetical protein
MKRIEEKCLQCGEILFGKIRMDEAGHTVLDGTSDLKLESSRFTSFLRCPYCRAKNAVTNVHNSFGISEVAISHLLDDE